MFIGIGLGINAIRADVAAAVLTPVNTGAPTFSPTTGKIGTSHTASGDTWDAYDEREYRVQVGGVTVSSSATYTPVGGDDGESMVGQVRARNTGGAWSAWASTAPLTVTYPVAVAAGALADQSYTQGTGDQTVNAALDFTGAVGGTWSVSGGGASIDGSGVVTIPTTSLLAGVTITVSYTNSGGVATSAFQVTVAAAASFTTTLVSSLTYRGITANFSPSVLLGYDATGRPIVVTDREIRLTSFSTPSTADKHGAMRRPRATDNATSAQGWDTIIGTNPVSGTGKIAYDPALNVDPGKTGVDFVVALGARDSIVKSTRRTDTSTYRQLNQLMTIMFLPPGDCFDGMIAPGPSDPDGTIYNSADIDLTAFRNLSKPSGFPTVAEVMSLDEEAWPYYGWSGENLRRIQTAGWASAENYSGNIAQYTSQLLYAGHYAGNDTDRMTIALALIRHGLDIDAAVTGAGWPGIKGAGQGHIHAQPHYAAAFLLGDTDLLGRAVATESNAFMHPSLNGSELEGMYVQFPSSNGQKSHYQRTFYADDIGKPWWIEVRRGSQPSARYSTQALVPNIYEAFPVFLLQNGPSGETGVQAALDGPDDSSNPRSALLEIYDRIRSWPDLSRSFSTSSPTSFSYETAFADWRSYISGFGWTGTPDLYDRSDAAKQDFTTDITGGFSWAIPGTEYTGNQTITEVGVEYSLDGVQYVDTGVTTLTGSKTGLLRGVEHIGRFRQKNASGFGPWSIAYPMATGSSDVPTVNRHRFTPSGTETAAAPVNTVAPKLFKPQYPRWPGPSWVEVSGTLTTEEVTLTIGLGYWSGYPAPTYAFKWQRNDGTELSPSWVDVATTQTYTYTLDETGKDIRAGLQATNASGSSAWAYTDPVTIPAAPSLPAGVHVELNFGASDPVYYPSIFSGAVLTNCTAAHRPTIEYGREVGDDFVPFATSVGAYCGDKTGANPLIMFPLGTYPAGTYKFTTHAVVGVNVEGENDDYQPGRFHEVRLLNQAASSGSVKYLTGGEGGESGTTGYRFPANTPGVPKLVTIIEHTFTLASSSPIWAGHWHGANTGGTDYGDVVPTYMKLEDA